MSLEYIRKYYNVPAKRGRTVRYRGKSGHITKSIGPYLRVLLNGEKRSRIFHPCDLEYVEKK